MKYIEKYIGFIVQVLIKILNINENFMQFITMYIFVEVKINKRNDMSTLYQSSLLYNFLIQIFL